MVPGVTEIEVTPGVNIVDTDTVVPGVHSVEDVEASGSAVGTTVGSTVMVGWRDGGTVGVVSGSVGLVV